MRRASFLRGSPVTMAQMGYSLRSLMIAVTAICVVIGGFMARVTYLRQMAWYHAEQSKALLKLELRLRESDNSSKQEIRAVREKWVSHDFLSEQYRRAVYRPWTIIDENDWLVPNDHD